MKIVYKISLFFAVILLVSACKLDQNSTSSITVMNPKEAFTSYSDAKNFANGMNTYFRNNTYGVFAVTADIQGDLFNASAQFANRGGAPHTMGDSFNASDYDIKAVWDGYYKGIVDYNYYLHNVNYVYEQSSPTAAQRAKIEQWKGAAYFYRAYSYFELAKKYCDAYEESSAVTALGLPFVGPFDINQKPARATLQVTMDSISNDLDKAATLLAKVPGEVRAIAPTIDAVNALKARFYLWTKQYDKAIVAADLLISNPTYALATGVEQMENEFYHDNGPEDIMQMFATVTEGAQSISAFIGQAAGEAGGVIYYTLPDFIPTKKLVNMYGVDDTRGKVFIDEFPIYYQTTFMMKTFVKYVGNPSLTTSPYAKCLNMPKIFRVAEMYLIKAEAEAYSGVGNPKATLNALQTARGAVPTGGTQEDVQTEWARETVGEGMRIECLKRWGILFTERPPQEATTNYVVAGVGYIRDIPVTLIKYTWPIPTSDIVFNENLVQNKGW